MKFWPIELASLSNSKLDWNFVLRLVTWFKNESLNSSLSKLSLLWIFNINCSCNSFEGSPEGDKTSQTFTSKFLRN